MTSTIANILIAMLLIALAVFVLNIKKIEREVKPYGSEDYIYDSMYRGVK